MHASLRGTPEIEHVLLETQGWFAVFTLLLAEGRDPDRPGPTGRTQRLLFDYFATERFARFDPPMQAALLRIALLPTMSAADAERLSGDATIGGVLAHLHRQNCFVVQREEAEPVFEYHTLFRAFLLDRAAALIPADAWRMLQCRAADLLAQTNQADAAAGFYRSAHDWQGLSGLALREAPSLISAGRHRTLEHWLRDLPGDVFQRAPWLYYWRAMARLPFDAAAARGIFEQAREGFEGRDDAVGLCSTWAGAMESFFFGRTCRRRCRSCGRARSACITRCRERPSTAANRGETGLELARRTGLHAFDVLLSAQMARCSLVAGDPAGAEGWLATMAGTMRSHSHIDGSFYLHLQSNAAAQHGSRAQALEHARGAMALALESGVPFLEAHCHLDLARALIGSDGDTACARHIRGARAIGQAMSSRVVEYLCLEAEAAAALEKGAHALGRDRLAHALAASHAMGGATWRMSGPQANARLHDDALAAGIDHVQHLIRRHRTAAPDPATAAESWPWAIRLYTLGRFEILCDDEPLRCSGKARSKPLELVKCLCAFGGQAVDQDRVADALWPEADGDAADQALRTTLHRLRKLLRHDQAVRLEGRHLHLDPRHV